jgi:pyrroline-5-carboxylate reductase
MTTPSILLIGAGHMGGALLKGWVASGLKPVVVVEPNPSPGLRRLAKANGVALHRDVEDVEANPRACVVALKPQILKTEAARLKPIADSGALMVSIAAGTGIAFLRGAWGKRARIVRAMPNVPGSIGRGISALYAPPAISRGDRALAQSLLSPLGPTLWLKKELLIDSVTALSGSGPAYVFLMVEALAAAGEAQGLPREQAEQLARATITGAGALLDADTRPPAELRRGVTSPGGTTQAALKILMAKDGLEALMRRAVAAATRRGKELGS